MDIKLHYNEKGRGEPFVLLHGNGENSDYFSNQIQYFSEKYRVIAVETRGHGRSPRGAAPFTITQFARDLRNLFRELEISRAIVLGFSDGANIALTFALKYPKCVSRLILNGANLNPQGVKPGFQIPCILHYEAVSAAARFFPTLQSKKEMLGLMVNQPHIYPGLLTRLDMPVLVIAGTRDMIKESHTRLIYESLPNAKLVFLTGTHFIARQNPHRFNEAVQEFLDWKPERLWHETMVIG